MISLDYLAIHHTGSIGNNAFASSQHLTAEDVNRYHKQKWNSISTLQKFGGYNFFIDKVGELTQFRAIGEQTLAQRYWNTNTVSICLSGNFTQGVDTPTNEQVHTLRKLLLTLLENTPQRMNLKLTSEAKLNLALARIFPHRFFQNDTACNGGLPDTWARDIAYNHYNDQIVGLRKILNDLLLKLQSMFALKKLNTGRALQTRMGSKDEGCCEGFIS